MSRFQAVFGDKKPVIAMVHLGASPGAPLHDAAAGVEGILTAARAIAAGEAELMVAGGVLLSRT